MNITLRPLKESDAEQLARIANNVKIRDGMRTGFPHPYTLEDAYEFINVCKKATHLTRAIDVDGSYAGQIGLFPKENGSAEIGYWIGEEFWGKGIISKAISLIIELSQSTIKPKWIYALVIQDNIGSCRALEKNGFILEGEVEEKCNEVQTSPTLLYNLRSSI